MTAAPRSTRTQSAWPRLLAGALLAAALAWPAGVRAEQGVLVVHVRWAHSQPLPRLRIGTVGDGSIEFTDNAGRARIRLAAGAQPGSRISLQVLPPPDLVMVSPWEGQFFLPRFEDGGDNVMPIVVCLRKDRRMLEDATVLAAAVAASARSPAAPARSGPASSPRSGLSGPARTASATRPLSWRSAPVLVPTAYAQADPDPAGGHAASPRTPERTAGSLITDRVAEVLGLSRDDIARAVDAVSTDSVTWRLVVLSGKIEAGGDPFTMVVGNVDGRGLYFGPLWANAKDGSLQRLFERFRAVDAAHFEAVMGSESGWVHDWLDLDPGEGLAALNGRVLEGPTGRRVREPWKSRLAELGRHPAFQRVQVEAMQPRADRARAILARAGLRSERALAFVYDLIYHQGFQTALWNRLPEQRAAFEREVGRPPDEQETLLIAAQLAIARVPPPLRRHTAARRLVFALGHGIVYGRPLDLDEAGFGMRDVETGEPIALVDDAAIVERLTSGWLPGAGAK